MKIVKPSQSAAAAAAALLKNGGVVICPTDTVYGFLADAQNKKAVAKIYQIKKRPKFKPLSVFVKDLKMAKEIAAIDKRQEKVLRKFWPGKYTIILKRKSILWEAKPTTDFVVGLASHKKLYGLDKNTVALRIPKHAFLQKILKKVNRPLAQTSVNISGKPPLYDISDIMKQFGASDILIVDGGNLKKSKPSKIIDISKDTIKTLRS